MADPGLQQILLQATEQAAELAQQLLAQDSPNTSALFLLSRSLTMLGRNNDAIKALEKAGGLNLT